MFIMILVINYIFEIELTTSTKNDEKKSTTGIKELINNKCSKEE